MTGRVLSLYDYEETWGENIYLPWGEMTIYSVQLRPGGLLELGQGCGGKFPNTVRTTTPPAGSGKSYVSQSSYLHNICKLKQWILYRMRFCYRLLLLSITYVKYLSFVNVIFTCAGHFGWRTGPRMHTFFSIV